MICGMWPRNGAVSSWTGSDGQSEPEDSWAVFGGSFAGNKSQLRSEPAPGAARCDRECLKKGRRYRILRAYQPGSAPIRFRRQRRGGLERRGRSGCRTAVSLSCQHTADVCKPFAEWDCDGRPSAHLESVFGAFQERCCFKSFVLAVLQGPLPILGRICCRRHINGWMPAVF